MIDFRLLLPVLTGLALAAPGPAVAASPAPAEAAQAVRAPAITRHSGTFGGEKIRYTATVSELPIVTGAGEGARIVSFAYTRDGVKAAARPVLFLFNGGPISPSPYLHIGGLGPRRIWFPDDVKADPSEFRLIDNPHSPLNAVDLVFIDPASTGFSRVEAGTEPSAYFSVDADARQFATFIRQWLKANGRTASPVYVLGESYGTIRAPEIARQLAEGPDPLPLAGVFLYGQAANIIEYSQRPANVASYVASLPTLAATAWYHGRIDRKGRTLEQIVAEASAFAKGDYLTALYQGSALPVAEQKRIAAELQALTGLSADWYLANALRISKEQYRLELLKDQGLLLGRTDARYTAPVTDKGGAPDPADVLVKAIQQTFPRYVRDELKLGWGDEYRMNSPVTGGLEGWVWGAGKSPFADWPYYTGISAMMKLNPSFKLMVASGYYDTMTTVGAAELLTAQSGWPADKVTLKAYDGGHMGYSVDATAKAMGDDIRAWVRGK